MYLPHRKQYSIALLVLALILYALQAGIWVRATINARSETDKANILEQRQPNEIPALAGTLILLAAAVIASIPQSGHRTTHAGTGAHHL